MERKELMKIALTWIGARCSEHTVYNLNGAFNYLHAGWWLRAYGFRPRTVLRSRDEVFRYMANDIGGREVLYLEFGVHRGASIKRWSELLRNPSAKLHGFDSFEGLPHDWRLEGHSRGHFSTAESLRRSTTPVYSSLWAGSRTRFRITTGPSTTCSLW